jgi:hypothetical protein
MPTDKCVSHSYTAAELAILLKKQAAERFPKPHNGAAIFHWDCWERAVEGTLEWQAAEFLMRQVGPSWRKCTDVKDGPECKGVHFLKSEAAAGGEICVTALLHGEFYECRFKVPPLATDGGNK